MVSGEVYVVNFAEVMTVPYEEKVLAYFQKMTSAVIISLLALPQYRLFFAEQNVIHQFFEEDKFV